MIALFTPAIQGTLFTLALMAAAGIAAIRIDPGATYWLSDRVEHWGSQLAKFVVWSAQLTARFVIAATQHTARRMRIRAAAKADANRAYKMSYVWHERRIQ